jgi:hypothetical protein
MVKATRHSLTLSRKIEVMMILQIDYSFGFNVSSTHLRADSNHARLSSTLSLSADSD